MKLEFKNQSKQSTQVYFIVEKRETQKLPEPARNLWKSILKDTFTAKMGSTRSVVLAQTGGYALFVGLGKPDQITAETLRRAGAVVLRALESAQVEAADIYLPQVLDSAAEETEALALGLALANYVYDQYKSDAKKKKRVAAIALISNAKVAADKIFAKIEVLARAVHSVRDWVNTPPSDLAPRVFAAQVQKLFAKKRNVQVKVYSEAEIRRMGMGAILGVSRGSAEPPALLHLTYKPRGAAQRKLALVGKGVTFDSGGLSLKPAQSMETMKMDMAGAASIAGVFQALAELDSPNEVHGVLALVENMPGGRAAKPGDIFKTMSGKTIEVLNTDAEGRLILADALTFAERLKPDAMINVATLTGAAVVALGSLIGAVMSNNEALQEEILSCAKQVGEPFWPLPLPRDYAERVQSKIADVRNIGTVRGEAGTIIGGLFLQEFVQNTPWAHLDIAGPAWSDHDWFYLTSGGTGFPLRTLFELTQS